MLQRHVSKKDTGLSSKGLLKKMHKFDVAILGGFGHVGLPLGIALSQNGLKTVLIDINEPVGEMINEGIMPFIEEDGSDSLKSVIGHTLFTTLDQKEVAGCHYVVVVLGTPVDEHLNPNFGGLIQFFRKLLPLLSDDQHVILRSTVYPGTTQKIKRLFEEHGLKTLISFCPERILQGKALKELRDLPQLIGAFDDESATDACRLFSALTDKLEMMTPLEAELSKLFTNSFRYIEFAIANQFYQICVDNSLDFYKIYQAARRDYPRMQSWPSAGLAAGPCLFKDTMQLAAYCNNNFFLGHSAMLVNEGLPNFMVEHLRKKHDLKNRTVAILGMAFKANIDDPRESLSYKLKKLLSIEAKELCCSDPYVVDPTLVPLEQAIECADIVVIGAPHSIYREMDHLLAGKTVVDIWNLFGRGGLF